MNKKIPLIALALGCLVGRMFAGNWGPSQTVYGSSPRGHIDLRYREEGGAWHTWYWEFHNFYATAARIYYTYTAGDGKIKSSWTAVDAGKTVGDTSISGTQFPNVRVTKVEIAPARTAQSGTGAQTTQPGNAQNGTLTFPGNGQESTFTPYQQPPPGSTIVFPEPKNPKH
jgi:hypothetical protein